MPHKKVEGSKLVRVCMFQEKGPSQTQFSQKKKFSLIQLKLASGLSHGLYI